MKTIKKDLSKKKASSQKKMTAEENSKKLIREWKRMKKQIGEERWQYYREYFSEMYGTSL